MSVPLYSRLSVTSKNEIRYEGVLVAVDEAAAALTLAQVKVHGTEGRTPSNEVAPFPNLFPSILFRGADIKELKLIAGPPPPASSPAAAPVQPVAQQAARSPQSGSPSGSPSGQALPSLPQDPTTSATGATQSRMTRLFQENNNKPASSPVVAQAPKSNITASSTASSGTKPVERVAGKEHTQQPTQQAVRIGEGAKRSVFDGAVSTETAVVTVNGLSASSNLGDVRKLFGDGAVSILSVRLLSLPDGGTAADVVFSSKSEAERAVKEFEHVGLSASLMDGSSGRRSADHRPASSARGGRTGGRGGGYNEAGRGDWGEGERQPRPPQVFRGRGGARGGGNPWNRRQGDSEGEEGRAVPRRQSQHASRPEPKGDFDFEAANAKFDRDEFLPTVPAASTKAKSSFFDDVGMHQNFERGGASGERGGSRRTEERKKDVETFGAIAYTYRGGSAGRGRGRGGQHGGGNRGGFRWNRPYRQGGEESPQQPPPSNVEGAQ